MAQTFALAGGRTSLVPTASLEETFTSNYRLSAADSGSDAVTRLSAGVKGQVRSARTQGFLDYTLSGLAYARHGDSNTHQQALASGLTTELVEKRLVVDLGATINRQSISAFGGAPVAGSGLANGNATEVRSWRVAPKLNGNLGGLLLYTATGSWTASQAADGPVGSGRTNDFGLHVAPITGGRLTWSADALHQRASFDAGRTTVSDRWFATANYPVDSIDTRFSANVGHEVTNLATAQSEGRFTWGGSVQWQPSPITQATATYDQRAFGHTKQLLLTHRTPRTVWQASSSYSLSYGTPSVGQRGTAFDLFYLQLASVEPDPVRRVDQVLALLQSQGLDPNARFDTGFLTSSATLTDQQQVSAAWRGQRDTAVLTLQQSASRRADPAVAGIDDLAAAGRLQTRTASLNLTHALTPLSNLTGVAVWQKAAGTTAGQYSLQRTFNLVWSQSLSPYLTASLSVRRGLYDVQPAGYTESAVTALLAARF